MMGRFIVGLILAALQGCVSHSVAVEGLDVSLEEVHSILKSQFSKLERLGAKKILYKTPYFDHKLQALNKPDSAKTRYYALIHVAGLGRPYSVYFQVYKETRQADEWNSEPDMDLAQKLAQDFRKRLEESRGKRNLIDAFKPF